MKQTKRIKGDVLSVVCLFVFATLLMSCVDSNKGAEAMFYTASVGGLIISSLCFCERLKKNKAPSYGWTLAVALFTNYSLHFFQSEYEIFWRMVITVAYLLIIALIVGYRQK